MIIYKDIFQKLKEKGYSTYKLRQEKHMSEATIQNIRDGKPVNLKTIDTICNLTGCRVEEILEHKPDDTSIHF